MKGMKTRRFYRLVCVAMAALSLSACGDADDPSLATNPSKLESVATETQAKTSAFKTIEWVDLIPPDDLEALENPPAYILEIEDGSAEDRISSKLQNTNTAAAENKDDRYQQALVSTDVVAAMDSQEIRLPGFIVPLAFNDEQMTTQFFLVPFFGACIHVPPPPPNQIILVNYPKGVELNPFEVLYTPFWISGNLKTSMTKNNLATSAYAMEMQAFEPYLKTSNAEDTEKNTEGKIEFE